MTYNSRKSAQVAAFFSIMEGGAISVLKLVKLVYLSDRKFLEKFDSLMLDDCFVSMDHGPVSSITYNYINGTYEDNAAWLEFVNDREKNLVGVASEDVSIDSLDELSRAEVKTLNEVWAEHGKKTPWQLREWTHHNCPEWRDPKGSSLPISYREILDALGKENSDVLENYIQDEKSLKIPA